MENGTRLDNQDELLGVAVLVQSPLRIMLPMLKYHAYFQVSALELPLNFNLYFTVSHEIQN